MRRVTSHPPTSPGLAAEADDATRGSAIKLAAEVLTRLITFGTTLLVMNALGVSRWDVFGSLWFIAPLIAELAEFGLQATASRARRRASDILSLWSASMLTEPEPAPISQRIISWRRRSLARLTALTSSLVISFLTVAKSSSGIPRQGPAPSPPASYSLIRIKTFSGAAARPGKALRSVRVIASSGVPRFSQR